MVKIHNHFPRHTMSRNKHTTTSPDILRAVTILEGATSFPFPLNLLTNVRQAIWPRRLFSLNSLPFLRVSVHKYALDSVTLLTTSWSQQPESNNPQARGPPTRWGARPRAWSKWARREAFNFGRGEHTPSSPSRYARGVSVGPRRDPLVNSTTLRTGWNGRGAR